MLYKYELVGIRGIRDYMEVMGIAEKRGVRMET